MGYQHFGLSVSLPLTPEQFAVVFRRLVGSGRRVDFRNPPSGPETDIVADVVAVDDPYMPRLFECSSDAGLEDLGPYPDLRFAVELWRAYGADSQCQFYPFADHGPDPRDLHRFLACVKGQWWLATVDLPRSLRMPTNADVTLVRPVELPAEVFGGPTAA